MTRQPMQDLPTGAVFIGPDERTRYRITKSAAQQEHGLVEVWNESMTDAEAAQRGAEPGCDPHEGVFMTGQIERDVEVISQ